MTAVTDASPRQAAWWRGEVPWRLSPERSRLAIRLAVAAVCLVLVVVSDGKPAQYLASVGLVVLALAVSAYEAKVKVSAAAAVVEAVLAVSFAMAANPSAGVLLVYWLVPAYYAGQRGDRNGAVAAVGLPALAGIAFLSQGGLDEQFIGRNLSSLAQWGALALAVALWAVWQQSLAQSLDPEVQRSYAEAARLLSELESLSRRLPAGLDVVTLGESLLTDLRHHLRYRDGFVELIGPLDAPEAIARTAGLDVDVVLHFNTPAAEPDALVRTGRRSTHGIGTVPAVRLPLVTREETVGSVVLLDAVPVDDRAARLVQQRVAEGAVQLEAAVLFDRLRAMATQEERRRLAREIHDGVAQDVAALGYAVDQLQSASSLDDAREQAGWIRKEITRVVEELRLSIFDLRAQVQTTQSLGAALAGYAQEISATLKPTLHVRIDESASRLAPLVEAELFRIAQEAITNARRHSGAQNIWLTCRVAPPVAELSVADDGRGIRNRRRDAFGLHVMQERAERIGAELRIEKREGGGTSLSVLLADRGSGEPDTVDTTATDLL